MGAVVAYPAQYALVLRRVRRATGASTWPLIEQLLRPALCGVVMMVGLLLLRPILTGIDDVARLAVLVTAGVFLYTAGSLALCRPLLDETRGLLRRG
jgi:hypothetical protein